MIDDSAAFKDYIANAVKCFEMLRVDPLAFQKKEYGDVQNSMTEQWEALSNYGKCYARLVLSTLDEIETGKR